MQIITFTDKTTNCSQKREGIRVGEYLAVTQDAFIYKVRTGRKLINSPFSDRDEAVKFAEYLEKKYRKYLPLWERWEDVDVFGLARHSVTNGNRILKIMNKLENGKSLAEIKNELSR